MGFIRRIFNPDEEKRRKSTNTKSSSSLGHSTGPSVSSATTAYTTGSTTPLTTPNSVSRAASAPDMARKASRSTSPPPPVPALSGLPSDGFTLQETIIIRKEQERIKERERERSRGLIEQARQREREEEARRYSPAAVTPRDSHIVGYTTSSYSQPVTPSVRDSPPLSRSTLPPPSFPSPRPNGLVTSASDHRSIHSSDDASTSSLHGDRERRAYERDLTRDYEVAMSRGMERLGSASSLGGQSAVSGLSGVRGWGLTQAPSVTSGQPFVDTVEQGVAAEKLKLIVVGSGFAGLATAIACARQGYQVTVVERGSGLSPHGDLITLGSNCTRLLARWGLFSDFWKRSAHGGWWLLKDYKGEMLQGVDLRDFPTVYGAPLMQGHRAQYLGVLGVEARMLNVGFKPNTEVVEFHDNDDQPSIITARGEVMTADAIVVCDGVNSYAKAFLAPELGASLQNLRRPDGEPETPTKEEVVDEGKQYSVHRAAMMSDRLRANPKLAYFLDGRMRTFVGPDSHLKIAPLDDNRQVSFTYLSRSRYAASTNWRDRRPVKEVTDTLEAEGWDETVIEAIKQFRTCLNWAVAEAPPSDKWVTNSGKIILIGDAVHALSPLSFQGGSQAIEDGAALAVCLALSGGTPDDIPRAFKAFETMRLPRVAEAQKRGTKQRQLWHAYHDSRSPGDLDLNITEAYSHDAELYTVAQLERTVQRGEDGERDFVVDPRRKKDVLRRLEVNGRNQREAEAEMLDPESLWENGGFMPDK